MENFNQHKMNDITKNKHGGNANSTAAFVAIKDELKPRQREVYNAIKRMHELCQHDANIKDICAYLSIDANVISGRLTELKAMGKIKVTGRRDGCAVYEINE
jgi:hypothetical protein